MSNYIEDDKPIQKSVTQEISGEWPIVPPGFIAGKIAGLEIAAQWHNEQAIDYASTLNRSHHLRCAESLLAIAEPLRAQTATEAYLQYRQMSEWDCHPAFDSALQDAVAFDIILALHSALPEDTARPTSWSDFSDAQIARAKRAAIAAICRMQGTPAGMSEGEAVVLLPDQIDILRILMAARKLGHVGINLDGVENLADYISAEIRRITEDVK